MSAEAVAENSPGGLERKWKILISIMFGIFMIILDSTVVNIAFPTLCREFGASPADGAGVAPCRAQHQADTRDQIF